MGKPRSVVASWSPRLARWHPRRPSWVAALHIRLRPMRDSRPPVPFVPSRFVRSGPKVGALRFSELIEKLSRKPVREKKAPGLDIGIEFNVYKLPGGPPAPVQPRHHYPEPEPVVVHSTPE